MQMKVAFREFLFRIRLFVTFPLKKELALICLFDLYLTILIFSKTRMLLSQRDGKSKQNRINICFNYCPSNSMEDPEDV